jgi:hypothetical protein
LRDRREYRIILAVVLLLAARGTSVGAAVASAGVNRGAAAGGVVWQQQATAGQSSAAPQSSGTQQGPNPAPSGSAMHSITVQFDYDFTKTPACSTKVTTACAKTFDVYDISGDKPYFLFSIPVPQNAQGVMKGITATSPRMLFAIGRHRIGVSAQMPNGEKSPPRDCKVIIEIKADNPPNPPASH